MLPTKTRAAPHALATLPPRYYHYTQNGHEVISRIADDEWTSYDEYHGKYLYDWDFTFRRQPRAGEERQEQDFAPPLLLLPNVAMTQSTAEGLAEVRAVADDASVAKKHKPSCPILSRW